MRRSDDTDSGRSSAPGDLISRHSGDRHAPVGVIEPASAPPPIYATSLKVLRRQHDAAAAQLRIAPPPPPPPPSSTAEPILLSRRRRAVPATTAALAQLRRNTIAVHAADWSELLRLNHCTGVGTLPAPAATSATSKSSECLGPGSAANTLPKLRIRRPRPRVLNADTSVAPNDPVASASQPPGPEFIRNSSRSPVELDICAATGKCRSPDQRRTVNVLLLNGRTLRIACNALHTTARHVFETVIRSERYAENFFLGLCALIGGDFVFLPAEVRVHKVAPQIWRAANIGGAVMFTLFVRVRLQLPNLRGFG